MHKRGKRETQRWRKCWFAGENSDDTRTVRSNGQLQGASTDTNERLEIVRQEPNPRITPEFAARWHGLRRSTLRLRGLRSKTVVLYRPLQQWWRIPTFRNRSNSFNKRRINSEPIAFHFKPAKWIYVFNFLRNSPTERNASPLTFKALWWFWMGTVSRATIKWKRQRNKRPTNISGERWVTWYRPMDTKYSIKELQLHATFANCNFQLWAKLLELLVS